MCISQNSAFVVIKLALLYFIISKAGRLAGICVWGLKSTIKYMNTCNTFIFNSNYIKYVNKNCYFGQFGEIKNAVRYRQAPICV